MRAHVAPLGSVRDAGVNRRSATEAIRAAVDDGAGLVVLPEYAGAFDPRGVGADLAEPLEGPFVQLLREESRRGGVAVIAGTVVPGMLTPGPGEAARAVNAAVVVVDGEVSGVYRKVHLYDAFGQRESDRLEPGPADAPPVVVDVAGLRVGVMTCYDLRFPESARRLVDAGATVLAVPAAWAAGEHKADQWRTLLRARAIESCAYVLGAAQHGPGVTGDSLLVDPLGVVQAASEGLSPARGPLDPQVVHEVREKNPSLHNRRYGVVPLEAGGQPAR